MSVVLISIEDDGFDEFDEGMLSNVNWSLEIFEKFRCSISTQIANIVQQS